MAKDRCAFCGALNAADAEWCGQCLRRFPPADLGRDPLDGSPGDLLKAGSDSADLMNELADLVGREKSAAASAEATASAAQVKPGARGAFTVTDEGITWTCSRCETRNALDAQLCSVCGTTFAEVVRPPVERPERDPNMAALISLFLPGAGHAYVGLWGQAIARAVIQLWIGGVVLIALFAGGRANASSVAIVFGLVGTVLWGVSAHDAYREARGEQVRVLLKGKFFLYITLGLLMLLFMMLVGASLQAR